MTPRRSPGQQCGSHVVDDAHPIAAELFGQEAECLPASDRGGSIPVMVAFQVLQAGVPATAIDLHEQLLTGPAEVDDIDHALG